MKTLRRMITMMKKSMMKIKNKSKFTSAATPIIWKDLVFKIFMESNKELIEMVVHFDGMI